MLTFVALAIAGILQPINAKCDLVVETGGMNTGPQFSADGKVVFWSSPSKIQVWEIGKHQYNVLKPESFFFAVSPTDANLMVTSRGEIWDLKNEKRIGLLQDAKTFPVKISESGKFLVCCLKRPEDKEVFLTLVNFPSCNGQRFLDFPKPTICAYPFDIFVAVGNSHGDVGVFDTTTGKSIFKKRIFENRVFGLVLLESQGRIIASDRKRTVEINIKSGVVTNLTFLDDGTINLLACTKDGKLLATYGGDDITIWNTDNWKIQQRFSSKVSVNGIAFSPDGKRIAIATGSVTVPIDGTIRVMDLVR